MATRNIVNTTLSGQTGTGTFVGSSSPTLVTPTLGAASATSISFSSTSGIIGTTTNDNAAAGSVGEFISSNIAFASATSISNATQTNLTSVSLTAGDWDVWGNVLFVPAAGTVPTVVAGGISTTSATLPDTSLIFDVQSTGFPASSIEGFAAPSQRLSLSGTTTVYIVAYTAFTVSTMTMCGGIYARRAR